VDLGGLFRASFVDWEAVAASWAKRTVGSRLLLFAARRYLSEEEGGEQVAARMELVEPGTLPQEIRTAFASPPDPDSLASSSWGGFVDAAVAAELEIVPYGERPILLGELRAGLSRAAGEAGYGTSLGRWFAARRDNLPGEDLPEDPSYIPV
jgi:hypothetical protein